MGKIINIRGTSGSGKSTVAREFLQRYPNEPLLDAKNKVLGYRVDLSSEGVQEPLYVVGRYTSPCGGGDTLRDEADAVAKCAAAQHLGHVLMERMLTSGSGPKGQFASAFAENPDIIYAVLDTPLEVCLERVVQRRAAEGNTKPFKPDNTVSKWYQTRRAAALLFDEGKDVRSLPYTDAFNTVLSYLKEAEQNG